MTVKKSSVKPEGHLRIMGVQVPTIEEHEALVERVKKLERDNDFLRSLLITQQWLSRSQTMLAIGCGKDKLDMLRKAGRIAYRYEGKRPFYEINSVRNYLIAQKVDAQVIDRQILKASVSAPV